MEKRTYLKKMRIIASGLLLSGASMHAMSKTVKKTKETVIVKQPVKDQRQLQRERAVEAEATRRFNEDYFNCTTALKLGDIKEAKTIAAIYTAYAHTSPAAKRYSDRITLLYENGRALARAGQTTADLRPTLTQQSTIAPSDGAPISSVSEQGVPTDWLVQRQRMEAVLARDDHSGADKILNQYERVKRERAAEAEAKKKFSEDYFYCTTALKLGDIKEAKAIAATYAAHAHTSPTAKKYSERITLLYEKGRALAASGQLTADLRPVLTQQFTIAPSNGAPISSVSEQGVLTDWLVQRQQPQSAISLSVASSKYISLMLGGIGVTKHAKGTLAANRFNKDIRGMEAALARGDYSSADKILNQYERGPDSIKAGLARGIYDKALQRVEETKRAAEQAAQSENVAALQQKTNQDVTESRIQGPDDKPMPEENSDDMHMSEENFDDAHMPRENSDLVVSPVDFIRTGADDDGVYRI